MASRKFPEGAKSNLRDLLDGYGTPTELYKYTGVQPPAAPSTRVMESTEYAAAPRKRVRPGLGEPGLERIKESLAEFREGPPEEPPTDEVPPDRSDLPKPEYIYPIKQSTKGTFTTKRPDKYLEFYKAAASQQSTRVHAMQWIPTHREAANVIGDIFVAFARPSNGKSSLFVYKKKDDGVWATLKVGGKDGSFGRAINALGSPNSYDDSLFSLYKEIHPDHETWIYDNMGLWDVTRPMNESVGSEKKRGILARAAADIEKELKELGF